MSKIQKLLLKILRGTSDSNIEFEELRTLLLFLGFDERIKGSHHIFTKDNVIEIINIQPLGNKAKNYQVKQVRNLVLKYKMALKDDE